MEEIEEKITNLRLVSQRHSIESVPSMSLQSCQTEYPPQAYIKITLLGLLFKIEANRLHSSVSISVPEVANVFLTLLIN